VGEVLLDEPPTPAAATIDDVLAAVREICGLTAEEMVSPSQGVRVSEGRALAAWGVLYLCDGTLTELGRIVGRDVTTLSSAVKRLVFRAKKDEEVAARMVSVRKTVAKFASLQS
jgi:chromosomal replication initiation ATPase DnaA